MITIILSKYKASAHHLEYLGAREHEMLQARGQLDTRPVSLSSVLRDQAENRPIPFSGQSIRVSLSLPSRLFFFFLSRFTKSEFVGINPAVFKSVTGWDKPEKKEYHKRQHSIKFLALAT